MSEHTIKIPLPDSGETLYVDYKGKKVRGYRLVSEDSNSPHMVVSGIAEAIGYAFPGIDDIEAVSILSGVSATLCNELKALKMESTPKGERLLMGNLLVCIDVLTECAGEQGRPLAKDEFMFIESTKKDAQKQIS